MTEYLSRSNASIGCIRCAGPNASKYGVWHNGDHIYEDAEIEGPDDLGYNNPNRFICTDPGCYGENCPGDNHSFSELERKVKSNAHLTGN